MTSSQTNHRKAFSLVELVVIIAIVALLSCLLSPGLARAKMKSWTGQCLNNKRQIQVGCALYSADNNQLLCHNDKSAQPSAWMKALDEDWYTSDANTNIAAYTNGTLSPYINDNVLLYRCPGDNIPSQNGVRIRSVSMNVQAGESAYEAYGFSNPYPGYRNYTKTSDFNDPSRIWIFCDESMYTINDGCLELDLGGPVFSDYPAAYHDGGNCFSYQDGHVAFQKWQGSKIIGAPYQYGVVQSGKSTPIPTPDPDWTWLKFHTAESY